MKGDRKRRKNGFQQGNDCHKSRKVVNSEGENTGSGKAYIRLTQDVHDQVFNSPILSHRTVSSDHVF